ncbi:MAG: hypothetical protein JXR95_12525 [Deltaproteobacteria bacterium]|nr:hypothetical protein [Deltaproteobacteria bacterium]
MHRIFVLSILLSMISCGKTNPTKDEKPDNSKIKKNGGKIINSILEKKNVNKPKNNDVNIKHKVKMNSESEVAVSLSKDKMIFYSSEGKETRRISLKMDLTKSHLAYHNGKLYSLIKNNIYLIDTNSGKISVAASLPAGNPKCLKLTSDNVQATEDFGISEKKDGFCISFKDHNVNMMNIESVVFIPFSGNPVVKTVYNPEKFCVPAPEKHPCKILFPARPKHPEIKMDSKTCKLSVSGKIYKLPMKSECNFSTDAISKSGNFILVSEITGSGDYIYRKLYLVRKSLNAIDKKDPTWEATGETLIQAHNSSDVFLIGNSIYYPEKKMRIKTPKAVLLF